MSRPDNTAVRVALWRALHVLSDAPPHVLDDTLGLKLADPPRGWQHRPDMSPFTKPFRASVVARSRFVEDLVLKEAPPQYVLLGAGLDTFRQRRPDLTLKVFEVDQPGTQDWKQQRLIALELPAPVWAPMDFEKSADWPAALKRCGFDPAKPAVVASLGVSMYLSRDAVARTLRHAAALAKGSVFVMSFLLPPEMQDPSIRVGVARAAEGAKAAGTPWLSFFAPEELLALAKECGIKAPEHVSADALADKYFYARPDGLRPPPNSEELLVART